MLSPDKHNNPEEPKDPHLDVPSVANQDKHINFREAEDPESRPVVDIDIQHEEAEKRRKEWHDGLEEGRRTRENSGDTAGD